MDAWFRNADKENISDNIDKKLVKVVKKQPLTPYDTNKYFSFKTGSSKTSEDPLSSKSRDWEKPQNNKLAENGRLNTDPSPDLEEMEDIDDMLMNIKEFTTILEKQMMSLTL
jgi:hypothetical protein